MKSQHDLRIAIKDIKAQLEKLEKVMTQENDYDVLLNNFTIISEATDRVNQLYFNYKDLLLKSKIKVEITRKQHERRYAAYYFRTKLNYTFKVMGSIFDITGARANELYRSAVRIRQYNERHNKTWFPSKIEAIEIKCKDKTVEDLIKDKTFFSYTPKAIIKQKNPYRKLLQTLQQKDRIDANNAKLLRECYLLLSNGITTSEVATHFKLINMEVKKLYEYSKKLGYTQ